MNITQTLAALALAAAGAGCSTTEPAATLATDACCGTNSVSASNHSPYASDWLPPGSRHTLPALVFEDQKGASVRLEQLRGAPVALSFAYTRCQNQRKCPAVARSLGELQRILDRSGIKPRPWIALMTYDPEFDTPEILAQFAEAHGLKAGPKTALLRPEASDRSDLFRALNVAVNYRDGLVNIHGIQLILLDKQGRPARIYHSLMWDNSAVAEDLAYLAAE